MSFTTIPTRSNGEDIEASWFEALKTAGETSDSDLTTHEADTSTHGVTEIVGTSETQTLSAKTLTSPVINTSISGTAFLDDDTMADDSATKVCSQQSIKAYFDNNISAELVSIKSADYTITDSDGITTLICDDTTADRTFNLPTLADNQGRIIRCKNLSTQKGKVTIEGEGAETIDGTTSVGLDFKGAELTLQGTSTTWAILSETITSAIKQYTLTVTGTNWTTAKAVGRPSRTLEGAWSIKGNITGTLSTGVTSFTATITGLDFADSTNNGQSVDVYTSGGNVAHGRANDGANTILGEIYTGGSASTLWAFTMNLELDSKPTFVE